MFLLTKYQPQGNSIQIEQNFSYAITNSKVTHIDPPLSLRFKTLESEKNNMSDGDKRKRIHVQLEIPNYSTVLFKNHLGFIVNNTVYLNELQIGIEQKLRRISRNLNYKNLSVIDQLIQGYLTELSRKRKVAPKPQGTDELLNYEVDQIYLDITRRDNILSVKFPNKNYPGVKQVFRNLLATAYDQQMFLDLSRLRVIHLGMQLTNAHFFKFKYHFLNNFLPFQQYMLLNISTEKMFHCCERIENIRPYILNEVLEFEIYGGEDGIKAITKSMYKKILSDVTLAPYFENIDVPTQELKFARLFFQLIYHLDSPNYSCEVLRERHVKYGLTNVQLTNFKYYLSLTLQKTGIPWRNIRQLLRRMDIYKYAIINKNDLQYYVNQLGFNLFIETFVNSCAQDAMLQLFQFYLLFINLILLEYCKTTISELIHRRGRQRFVAHCCNIFHYFFRYNIKAITREDLHLIHQKKAIINEKIFDKFKQKAVESVRNLTDDSLVLQDFIEDWDEIKPIILGETREQQILSLGQDYLIPKLVSILEYEFVQRHLNKIYETEEAEMSQSILCKLNLLLYGVRFFKKQDLQIIHKRFKITSLQYYDFAQCFKIALEEYKVLNYVHQLIEEYEQFIVSD